MPKARASCPLCSLGSTRNWIENEHAIAVSDAHPVSEGHTLVIPRKHVKSIYDLNLGEQNAVWSLVARMRNRLLTKHKPNGFNIGIDDGVAAGQTIEHAHLHVIPRRRGDVTDPRGGIRLIIAETANYWNK